MKMPVSRTRHYAGFVLAGALALATDALLLTALTHGAGITAIAARPISIFVAMIVSWLINRSVTFAYPHAPSFQEFGQFAAVSWLAQAVNYAIFAAILLLAPGTHPIAALIGSSLVAMFVSYAGFRFGVFRHR